MNKELMRKMAGLSESSIDEAGQEDRSLDDLLRALNVSISETGILINLINNEFNSFTPAGRIELVMDDLDTSSLDASDIKQLNNRLGTANTLIRKAEQLSIDVTSELRDAAEQLEIAKAIVKRKA